MTLPTAPAQRVLYLDCIGGVAGDMLLGALLDAGASLRTVLDGLAGLGLEGADLQTGRVQRHGIGAVRAQVTVDPHVHHHRTWGDVRQILDRSTLSPPVLARASRAFELLAEAEGRIHDVPPDAVHFHEVGGDDAIIDICGVALAVESLRLDRIVASPVPIGRGTTDAAHGVLPLPAPATIDLLRGAPVYGIDSDVEVATPTGAALLMALTGGDFGPPPAMTVLAVGYGSGERDTPQRPNLVRAILGSVDAPVAEPDREEAVLVECTLDDLHPELVPDAIEACTAAGALDVWVTPVQMKKGRPGIVLTALARPADEARVIDAVLRNTSTLGVRMTPVHRRELSRELTTVEVRGHQVKVKLGRLGDDVVNVAPEHDDVARVARALGVTVKALWPEVVAAAHRPR